MTRNSDKVMRQSDTQRDIQGIKTFMTQRQPDDLLTPEEVANRYKVSVDTVHRAVRKGALPALRVGPKLIRIRAEDADRFAQPINSSDLAELASDSRRVRRTS
jgi:excisionase family DNA binding protein